LLLPLVGVPILSFEVGIWDDCGLGEAGFEAGCGWRRDSCAVRSARAVSMIAVLAMCGTLDMRQATYRRRYTACEPVLGRLAPRALPSIVESNRPFLGREDDLASGQPCSARVCSIMFAVSVRNLVRDAKSGLGGSTCDSREVKCRDE
jgi:hypothetical protein